MCNNQDVKYDLLANIRQKRKLCQQTQTALVYTNLSMAFVAKVVESEK